MRRWKVLLATGVALASLGGVGINVIETAGPAPLAQAVAATAADCTSSGKKVTTTKTVPTPTATTVESDPLTGNPTATVTAYGTATTTTTATQLPANCVPWLPGWRPQLGPIFNDPLGGKKKATAIVRRIRQAIVHTPRGGQIRIAVYSFDRAEIASALKKAYKRGVSVQVVVNKSVMSSTAKRLQKVLGKKAKRNSFLIACAGRCRKAGKGGNEHDKVFAFSRSGGAQYLVITDSGNLTSKGVYRQWNDSYAVANDKGLYDTWVKMFAQMAAQKQTGGRVLTYTSTTTPSAYTYSFQRQAAEMGDTPSTYATTSLHRYNAKADLPAQQINKVSCRANRGYGSGGRTVIRVAMYAMFGSRGRALTKMLINKKRQGCDVKMIMSVPGKQWPQLVKAGIPVRSGDWMFAWRDPAKEDGIGGYGPRFYSHLKFMAISGTYNGANANLVITGSENWSNISKANEEMTLQINDKAVYTAYVNHFNGMFNGRATHKMGIKPTGGPKGS
ncbi:phospholipase D-like domain-containing protein [Nocardioides sp. Kera G14]|uniref:phospholipase D-like domain-containing protein n=1 Tax=Nocardioides sp. Kera G14 TaxID=2884264 RepID=UPI001D104033|nr:phospholipase D-like domain-containing protein [Nocardioides sp. Kera G14]UDY24765.1 phospholipase D-like domain-containing protein [Nocardioides sp. Kera G14]